MNKVVDQEIPEDVLTKILEKTNKETTPEEFENIFSSVRDNSTLKWILAKTREDLEWELKKIAYATVIFNDDIFLHIWVDRIKSSDMTLEKIRAIKKLWTIKVKSISADDFLAMSVSQIEALKN